MASKLIYHIGKVKFSNDKNKSGKFAITKNLSVFFRIPFVATISKMSKQDYAEILERKSIGLPPETMGVNIIPVEPTNWLTTPSGISHGAGTGKTDLITPGRMRTLLGG